MNAPLKITGRVIEVGNLDGGSTIGVCIDRGDGRHIELVRLTEDEAREIAPAYDQQVTVSIALAERQAAGAMSDEQIHAVINAMPESDFEPTIGIGEITALFDDDNGEDAEVLESIKAYAKVVAYRAILAAAQPVQEPPSQQPDIKAMVNRFLGWKLPSDFNPDCGISFAGKHPYGDGRYEPIGTNLFTADQATAMFEHCCATAQAPNTKAAQDVLAERRRQMEQEGWTTYHDDKYLNGDMAVAASCYAWAGSTHAENDVLTKRLPLDWPWSAAWWKPKDKRSNLVRAGALILAEIERLDRVAAPLNKAGGEVGNG